VHVRVWTDDNSIAAIEDFSRDDEISVGRKVRLVFNVVFRE
jgi:hypothetical protein